MKKLASILFIITIVVMMIFFSVSIFTLNIMYFNLVHPVNLLNLFLASFTFITGFLLAYLFDELITKIKAHKYLKLVILISVVILSSCATTYKPISSKQFRPTHKAKCKVYDDTKEFGSVKESMRYYYNQR